MGHLAKLDVEQNRKVASGAVRRRLAEEAKRYGRRPTPGQMADLLAELKAVCEEEAERLERRGLTRAAHRWGKIGIELYVAFKEADNLDADWLELIEEDC